jgi:small subunit ribosomal protein S4e
MSLHLKRLASPRAWHIPKKAATWSPKPRPGPHAMDKSVPVGLLVRDYLKLADTMREVRRILGAGEVMVDGKVAKDPKQVVGFMDVLSIKKTGQNFRALYDHHGRIVLHPIQANAATWKLCRIEDKTTVKEGRTQLNLHDGRNVLVKEKTYKTGDVVKMSLPEQKVLAHYPLSQGSVAVITGGKHIGELASVASVEVTRNPKPNLVAMKAGDREFSTIKPYVFVVGKDKAEITLPTPAGEA